MMQHRIALPSELARKLAFIDDNVPGKCYAVGGTVIALINGIDDFDGDLDIVNEGIDPRPIQDAGFVKSPMFKLRETIGELYTHQKENIDCVFLIPKSDEDAELTGIDLLKKDADHRDFTICSVYINCNSLEIYDPTGKGLNDIKSKTLRMEQPEKKLTEDPIRFLRLAKYMANGYKPDDELENTLKTFNFANLEFDINHFYTVVKKHFEQFLIKAKKKYPQEHDKFNNYYKELTNLYAQALDRYGLLKKFFNIVYEESWDYTTFKLTQCIYTKSQVITENDRQVFSPTMPTKSKTNLHSPRLFTASTIPVINETEAMKETTDVMPTENIQPYGPQPCLLPKEIMQHFQTNESSVEVEQNKEDTPLQTDVKENNSVDSASSPIPKEIKAVKNPNRKKHLSNKEKQALKKEKEKNKQMKSSTPIMTGDTRNNNNNESELKGENEIDVPQNKGTVLDLKDENIEVSSASTDLEENKSGKKSKKKESKKKAKANKPKDPFLTVNETIIKQPHFIDQAMQKINKEAMKYESVNGTVTLFIVYCVGDYQYMGILCGRNNTARERKLQKIWNEDVNALQQDLLKIQTDPSITDKLCLLQSIMSKNPISKNAYNDIVNFIKLIKNMKFLPPMLSNNMEYTFFPFLTNDIHNVRNILEQDAWLYVAKLHHFVMIEDDFCAELLDRFKEKNVRLADKEDLNENNYQTSNATPVGKDLFTKLFLEPEENFQGYCGMLSNEFSGYYKKLLSQIVSNARKEERNNSNYNNANLSNNPQILFNQQNQQSQQSTITIKPTKQI